MKRKGCIYQETHYKCRHNVGFGCPVHIIGGARDRGWKLSKRWVGEYSYHGHRYRCRSHDLGRVEAWLRDMQEKFDD